MDTEEMRLALTVELERVTAALNGEPEVTATESERARSNEALSGYREGVEFALGLIGTPVTTPKVVEEIVRPGPAPIVRPEPELLDKVERVRDTEV
jgi:hypothetical protein